LTDDQFTEEELDTFRRDVAIAMKVANDRLETILGKGADRSSLAWPPPRSALADEVLAGAHDTQSRFSVVDAGERIYNEARAAIHDAIVNEALADAAPAPAPLMTVIAGGSGSGKSFYRAARGQRAGEVVVDADELKGRLDEYQRLSHVRDPYAAFAVHEESSDLVEQTIAVALARRCPIVWDLTGDGAVTGGLQRKLQQAVHAGAKIDVVYVDSPIQVAIERVIDRFVRTGRFLVPGFVLDVHRHVSERFLEIAGWDGIDRLVVVDGASDGAPVIAERQLDGHFAVTDPVRWKQFLMKASL
jgi:predicted ABC-type ATPase